MAKINIICGYACLAAAFLLLAACHGRKQGQAKAVPEGADSVYRSEALKRVTDSIRRHPDSSRLYYERGNMLFVMKEYKLAGKDIRKAIDLNPLKADYYIALGEIELTADSLEDAAAAFRRAVRVDPDNPMGRLQLSFVLLQQKKYQATIRQADSVIRLDPRLPQAYGLQAQAYQALGDTVAALHIMQKAVKLAPGNYDALMALGDLLLRRTDSAALLYYRRAAEADTTQAEPLYCIGLFYERAGNSSRAVQAYRDCIDRDAYYLDAYLRMGKIYEGQNQWKKALKIFTLAIRVSPASSEVYNHLGLCEEKLGNFRAAMDEYENALALKQTNRKAAEGLARVKAHQTQP
jgi:tetratricopeptide (TPR) repeat protein